MVSGNVCERVAWPHLRGHNPRVEKHSVNPQFLKLNREHRIHAVLWSCFCWKLHDYVVMHSKEQPMVGGIVIDLPYLEGLRFTCLNFRSTAAGPNEVVTGFSLGRGTAQTNVKESSQKKTRGKFLWIDVCCDSKPWLDFEVTCKTKNIDFSGITLNNWLRVPKGRFHILLYFSYPEHSSTP